MAEDALIIGGGIAGLQAAIQLGRGGHRVLVVDAGRGRSTLCRGYHNVLGWPDGVSGEDLRLKGREHAAKYGVRFVEDEAVHAEKTPDGFRVTGRNGGPYEGAVLLVATGVMDRFPQLQDLEPCLGRSIYVCPDCDAYEIRGKKTVVLGAGATGAAMAMTLHGTAGGLAYINHEVKPVEDGLRKQLAAVGIPIYDRPIRELLIQGDGQLQGVILDNGERVDGEKGFLAFGGNEVRTDLLKQLGVERMENGHAIVDPRTKETAVKGVWAAGDIGVHSEQLVIAMGDGMQAAIWMHKALTANSKNKPAPAGAT